MPINWQDPETKDRLLAAIIASFDHTINCREVARLFGGEATYNAIENFLRKPKKEAAKLKANASDAPASSPARPRSTPKKTLLTPTKDGLTTVKTGRVTKKKADAAPKIKSEIFDENESKSTSGDEAEREAMEDGECI